MLSPTTQALLSRLPIIAFPVIIAVLLLRSCDGSENEVAIIPTQTHIAATFIQNYAHQYPPSAGAISRPLLIAALYDQPHLAVSERPSLGQEPQAGTQIFFRKLDTVTMYPSSDGLGMLTFGLQGISKKSCTTLANIKPATDRDVAFSDKDHLVYFYSPDAAKCDDPKPTVSLRYCAPLLGPCPAPLQ